MSSRTSLTVRPLGAYPEMGPATKTWENCDVTNGNKLQMEPDVAATLFNSSGAAKTVTYSYDDDSGVARTNVLNLAAGEVAPVQFEARLGRHAADTAESNFVWLTANGTAGDVKVIAYRQKRPLS